MTKMRDMQVFEILYEVKTQTTTMERANYLRTNFSDHQPLQYILKWNFDETLVSVLPEGDAPINSQEEMDGPSPASLWAYLKLFPRFVDCDASRNTPVLRREALFVEMLEALDPKEAQVIVLAKDKLLTTVYDNCTSDVVQQAFPSLIATPSEAAKPLTPSERAEELKEYAKVLKEQARGLNKEAKQLEAEAKDLLKAEA